MAELDKFLQAIVERKCSDLHVASGVPMMVRHLGEMTPLTNQDVAAEQSKGLIYVILTDEQKQQFEERWELDTVYTLGIGERYRVTLPDGTTRQVAVTVEAPAGAALAVGSYAVGGTLAPSLNAWSCGGGFLLLILLVGLLVAPGLYDRARGRGQVVQLEAEPEAEAEPESKPQPPAAPSAVAATCPACGEVLRPGARFCKQCGKPTVASPQATTCPRCGKALRPSAKFCANCGHRV